MKIKIKGNLVAFVVLLALCVCGMGLLLWWAKYQFSLLYYYNIDESVCNIIQFCNMEWKQYPNNQRKEREKIMNCKNCGIDTKLNNTGFCSIECKVQWEMKIK